jgi:hypothetical protein
VENRISLFLFVGLDLHEANYHAFLDGVVTEDVWVDWLSTLKLDLALPDGARLECCSWRVFGRLRCGGR